MTIAGLQKLSLLDYPGKLCATVFLSGCGLRCPFCHNTGLLTFDAPPLMEQAALLDFLAARKGKLEAVCITGGEPLLSPGLTRLIEDIRALSYSVKLDTNGTLPDRLAALLNAGLLDYVAMDIKHAPEKYALACGVPVDIAAVKKSIALLQGGKTPYEFRTTAVAPLHRPADFAAIGRLIEGAPRYFIQKYVDSGDILAPEGLSALTDDEMRAALQFIQPYVPNAALRGM